MRTAGAVKLPKLAFLSPKESKMTLHEQMRALLWQACPPRPEDNRKSWFTWVAARLGWKRRRVVAIFRGEARVVVTAEELLQLQALHRRSVARKEKIIELTGRANDLRIEGGGKPVRGEPDAGDSRIPPQLGGRSD